MNFFDILFLGLALSVDAFVVAFSYGLVIKKKKGISALKIAFSTGMGQFIMPVFGWYGASSIYHQIEQIDHWIAFILLVGIGINMIKEAFSSEKEETNDSIKFKDMIILAIATSIDALAVGVTFAFLNVNIILSIR